MTGLGDVLRLRSGGLGLASLPAPGEEGRDAGLFGALIGPDSRAAYA
jgi:hypothetical protein